MGGFVGKMIYTDKIDLSTYENRRTIDNFKMQYAHVYKTCKSKSTCLNTNDKIFTCDKYWADLSYQHK